jgi:hypothetical protein
MAAIAPLEQLVECSADIKDFELAHPEAAEQVKVILGRHRKIGYKNICKMMMGATAEELKE